MYIAGVAHGGTWWYLSLPYWSKVSKFRGLDPSSLTVFCFPNPTERLLGGLLLRHILEDLLGSGVPSGGPAVCLSHQVPDAFRERERERKIV